MKAQLMTRFLIFSFLLIQMAIAGITEAPPLTLRKQIRILGYGTTVFNKDLFIIKRPGAGVTGCKWVKFRPYWNQVIGNGVVNYDKSLISGKSQTDWKHWTVYFRKFDKMNGTAKLCVNSGGWSSDNSETVPVSWMIYGI